MSLLTEQVKEEAKRLGARIAGIGVPDRWANAPKGHKPQDFVPDAKAVVSFGMPLFRAMARWSDFMRDSEIFSEQKVEGRPTRLGAAQEIYGRMQYYHE